ncbi:Threonine aspartase 1 [Trichinella patagoniensis]|uniref:Threonine aspartase 1 n=1 Tax=Trichinella patagoniensis TaxID=990121 RepID=A0A0V0ZMD0_9BILA|nr:Threonine aspartase 1 [Trichinella patagoniensis]
MMNDMFVAVHAGAGYYPRKQRDEILHCLQKACKVALNEMKKGKSSLHACTQATIIIENCPLTNAGLGSNLTLNETVECDAGLMDGKTMNFAGVGALQGVKNPISLAKSLLDAQNHEQDGEQLIQPMLLVSDGALQYAKSVGLETVDFKDMIVENSVQTFRRNLSNLVASGTKHYHHQRVDTVGSICLDSRLLPAASCSSGGLLLKVPGRVGQAALYGCGCWAEAFSQSSCCTVSCSGCGEYLIKTQIAKKIARALVKPEKDKCPVEIVVDVIEKKYLQSKLLADVPKDRMLIGCICALRLVESNDYPAKTEFLYAHNSETFTMAYMSSKFKHPISFCSTGKSLSKITAGGCLL